MKIIKIFNSFIGQAIVGAFMVLLVLNFFIFFLFNKVKSVIDINKESAIILKFPETISSVEVLFLQEYNVTNVSDENITAEGIEEEYSKLEEREDEIFNNLDQNNKDYSAIGHYSPEGQVFKDDLVKKINIINDTRGEMERLIDEFIVAFGEKDIALQKNLKKELHDVIDNFEFNVSDLYDKAHQLEQQQYVKQSLIIDDLYSRVFLLVIILFIVIIGIGTDIILQARTSFSILLNGIKKIQKGNLSARISLYSENEFGSIARFLNEAVDKINKSNDETNKINLDLKEQRNQLEERVVELKKFHKLTVGRELKMIELKKEIETLKKQIK